MLEKNHLHYQTRDTGLAVTLATAGIPFLPGRNGKIVPIVNIYTPELLRTHGYKGRDIEEAVIDAWQRGIRGLVWYNFQRTPLCEKLLKVWNSHTKTMEKADDLKLKEVSVPFAFTPEQITVFGAQFFSNRKALVETMWRKTLPMYPLDMESKKYTEPGEHGDRTILVGSFKLITVHASPELKRKLKIAA